MLKIEEEEYQKKLDILLLFDYLSVKSENRFNKSKSESFGKLSTIQHIIINMDFMFLILKKLLFF